MTTALSPSPSALTKTDLPLYRTGTPAAGAAPAAAPDAAEQVSDAPRADGARPDRPNLRRRYAIAGIAAVVSGLAVTEYYLRCVAPFESTDDAFVEAHVTPIAPQVAGRVATLAVEDNQEVHQGDLLLAIDPRDYQAQLDQTRAALAAAESRLVQAEAQLTVDQARIGQEQAGGEAAAAEAQRASADAERYQTVGKAAVSESLLDSATAQARSANAQLAIAHHRLTAAEAQAALNRAGVVTAQAEVRRATADVRKAELALSYTRVVAPEDGVVTHRTVEYGAYVQPGQALLAVVPHHVWVIANFKETQLAHMRPGQPVSMTVDAFPQLSLNGRVDSIQSGSGPRFSLLPPENASGNYVKVVQRLPVKIVLDASPEVLRLLGPGMSVVPEVRVQ